MIKIITTCYNCEDFIERCIKSVVQQQENDWELYITDDASTDKSIEIAEKAAREDPRIKIIKNNKNRGAVYNKTFNFVSVAKPNDEDIIVTLDGDDFFCDPQALTYLKKVYSKGYWFTYGGADHSKGYVMNPNFYTPVNWSRSLRNQDFCLGHLRSHKFFLLKNVKDVDLRYRNGTLFKIPEDIVLFIPMAEMAGPDKCFHIDIPLYFYRMHDNTDWKNPEKDNHRGDIVSKDLSFRPPYKTKTKYELIRNPCDWTYEYKRNII